jgi:hypothetical protein
MIEPEQETIDATEDISIDDDDDNSDDDDESFSDTNKHRKDILFLRMKKKVMTLVRRIHSVKNQVTKK